MGCVPIESKEEVDDMFSATPPILEGLPRLIGVIGLMLRFGLMVWIVEFPAITLNGPSEKTSSGKSFLEGVGDKNRGSALIDRG